MADNEQNDDHQQDHQNDLDPQLGEELLDAVHVVKQRVGLHADAGHQGEGAVLLAVEGGGDGAQHLPLFHGSLYRVSIAGVGECKVLGGDVVGQQGGNFPLRLQSYVVGALAQSDLDLGNVPLGGVQNGLGGEVLEAPLKHPDGLIEVDEALAAGGVRLPLTAHDHGDETAVILGGGGRQAVAGLVGVAGLDAGGVGVEVTGHIPVGDQGIGGVDGAHLGVHVGGGHVVAFGGDNGAEGLVLHGLLAHEEDVIGGGVVVVVMVAVGVGKVGVVHAQLCGPLVHQFHKAGHIAGHRLGHYVAGLVGGGDEGGIEQVDDADLLPLLDVGCGGAGADAGMEGAAGGDGLLQGELPLIHRLQGEQAGHHLGDGGGVHLLVGVFLIEHLIYFLFLE